MGFCACHGEPSLATKICGKELAEDMRAVYYENNFIVRSGDDRGVVKAKYCVLCMWTDRGMLRRANAHTRELHRTLSADSPVRVLYTSQR